MTLAIGYEPNCGVIVIQGNGVFPARSLTATLSAVLPDTIAIKDLGGRGEQTVVWGDLTSLDGSFTPASMADALAYLQGEFAKCPDPISGPRGPGIFAGPGDPDPSFGLAGDLYIDATSGDLFSKGD